MGNWVTVTEEEVTSSQWNPQTVMTPRECLPDAIRIVGDRY